MVRLFVSFMLMFVIAFPLSTRAAAHANTKMLDIIPHDAMMAVAIKSVEETGKHFNNFSNDSNIRPGMQPAMAIQMALGWLGVTEGLDNKAPVAVILPNARKLKEGSYNNNAALFEKNLVVVLPYRNLNQLARSFNTNLEKLKTGATVKGRGIAFGKFFKVRGKYLYLGNNKKMVEDVVAAKSAATKMTVKQIKHANNSDALLHVGTRAWGKDWDVLMKEWDTWAGDLERVRLIDMAIITKYLTYFKYLSEATEATDFGVITVRYDKGLATSGLFIFREDKKEERKKLLEKIRGSNVPPTLNGLANNNLLFAFGHSVSTQKTISALAGLVGILFAKASFGTSFELFTIIHHKNTFDPSKNICGAVYLNHGKERDGLVSATIIIEPEQVDVLLETFRDEAKTVYPAGSHFYLPLPGKEDKKVTKKQIEKLIALMGDVSFKKRVSATNQLEKIGKTAISDLKKATKHHDKEIALRAEWLIGKNNDQITQKKNAGNKIGFSLDFPFVNHVTYHYTPQAEVIDGHQVDIISLNIPKFNRDEEIFFKEILGNNWKHIRLVRMKNQVIIHWGSDLTSLKKTLKNRQTKKGGLEEHPSLKEYQQLSSHPQKIQMHFSLTNLIPLWTEEKPRIAERIKATTTPLSSLSLTIDSEQFQIDTWIPRQELKNAMKGKSYLGMGIALDWFSRIGSAN